MFLRITAINQSYLKKKTTECLKKQKNNFIWKKKNYRLELPKHFNSSLNKRKMGSERVVWFPMQYTVHTFLFSRAKKNFFSFMLHTTQYQLKL
jgi:hypothetical protein